MPNKGKLMLLKQKIEANPDLKLDGSEVAICVELAQADMIPWHEDGKIARLMFNDEFDWHDAKGLLYVFSEDSYLKPSREEFLKHLQEVIDLS